MALQGCNYHVCNLPATNQRVSQTAPRSEYGWGGSFPKGGRFQTSDAKGCRAPKNKPSGGGGESKCGVQREMCADLLSSSPDTPTSTRQRQPGPSLRGVGCQPPACVHARTHTDTHTLSARQQGDALAPRHRPCSRSGALGGVQRLGRVGSRCGSAFTRKGDIREALLGAKSKGTWGPTHRGKDAWPGKPRLETRAARRGSTRCELGFLPLGPARGPRPRERKRPALSPARCPFVTTTGPSLAPTPTPRG